MLSRTSYSRKVITIFEIIGCFFVDIFYNQLYETAKGPVRRRESEVSITDAYKKCVKDYIFGISHVDKYYKQTINTLLQYYQSNTSQSTITLNNFINTVIQQYVPQEYYDVMSEKDKTMFIGNTITNVLKAFKDYVLKIDVLRKIIDNHEDSSNIRLLTDKIIDIQILIREDIFQKFVGQVTHSDDNINRNVAEKILQERNQLANHVKKLLKENCTLKTELEKARRIVETLYDENNVLRSRPQPPNASSLPAPIDNGAISDPPKSRARNIGLCREANGPPSGPGDAEDRRYSIVLVPPQPVVAPPSPVIPKSSSSKDRLRAKMEKKPLTPTTPQPAAQSPPQPIVDNMFTSDIDEDNLSDASDASSASSSASDNESEN